MLRLVVFKPKMCHAYRFYYVLKVVLYKTNFLNKEQVVTFIKKHTLRPVHITTSLTNNFSPSL